ncbi:hypothetical protein SAMN05216330_1011092 [Bradyrhizobium sp. Ghvi]|nr:hypothetical protein SAMN05216330_1011092 [Bradyrhizobium sp. Ghvi]
MFHVKRASDQFHEINPMHSSSRRVFHVKQVTGSSRGPGRNAAKPGPGNRAGLRRTPSGLTNSGCLPT